MLIASKKFEGVQADLLSGQAIQKRDGEIVPLLFGDNSLAIEGTIVIGTFSRWVQDSLFGEWTGPHDNDDLAVDAADESFEGSAAEPVDEDIFAAQQEDELWALRERDHDAIAQDMRENGHEIL